MEQRNLGASGLRVSVVGFGTNNLGGRLDAAATNLVVNAAVDAGITLFDTADRYPMENPGRSEELLGAALGNRRDEVLIATKFGLPLDKTGRREGASRRYIMSAVDASLQRLNTDRIDLYQIHTYDPSTPIEETMCALDDLVTQGKVRYIGCSNFAAWQITDAQWTAKHLGRTRFISAQDHYSLLERSIDAELMPAIGAMGMGMLPFFPLASGLLSGKYRNGARPAGTRVETAKALMNSFMTEANLATVDKLDAFATKRGHTILELAFSWLLARPGVACVIAGASNPEQIAQNVSAAAWTLTPDDLAEIDAITGAPAGNGH